MNNIIQIDNLHFSYSKKKVLDGLTLNVPDQSIYGFLGPNGSGKTTTIRLLLGLAPNKEDNIVTFNHSLRHQRLSILQKTGALVEMPSLYPHLSGFQNLELTRKLIGGISRTRTEEVLEIVKMKNDAHLATKKYSLGMKQRLGLAVALLNKPQLLILDEPTNGLDPSGIKEMRELIVDLHRNHNKTIFLSSHLLAEIEKMATHVGILKAGKCVFEGKLDDLQRVLGKNIIVFKVSDLLEAENIIRAHTELTILKTSKENNMITLQLESEAAIAKVNALLVQHSISVFNIAPEAGDLESLFIELTEPSPL